MTQTKKRILVPIVGQGSIASVIRTGMLEEMQLFCNPVICMLWEQEDLIKELKNKSFEVYLIPKLEWSHIYSMLRHKINYPYKKYVLNTKSSHIESGYRKKFLSLRKRIRSVKETVKNYFTFKLNPELYEKLIAKEKSLFVQEKSFYAYKEWLQPLNVDGIFTVSPFLPEVELIARILKNENKLLLAAIHSFDNITKRPWPAIHFDAYSVWNNYNKNELQRIFPHLPEENIHVNGAPQFDFHFNENFLLPQDEWKRMLGIQSNNKIILYAGGWQVATPFEEQYVEHIMLAIRNGKIKGKPTLLLRGHPLDSLDRWNQVREKYPEIVMDKIKQGSQKFDFTNLSEHDIKNFCSTLHYSDVHVNFCSTMTIDGAAHNKPQIGPYYDMIKAEKALRKYYFQEHYLPVVNSGALTLAGSPELLQASIDDALSNPLPFTKHNNKLLQEVITYGDGKSACRIIQFLKKYIAACE